MRIRPIIAALALGLTLAGAAPAFAQTPDDFVQTGHHQLESLLRQPALAQRDQQIASAFDRMMDYDELVKRCFREHWATLTPDQQAEVSGLLKEIVRRNYKKNLKRTLDYNVTYTGMRGDGNDIIVRTQAQSRVNVREPVVQIDYVVEGSGGGPFHVVDIKAENSSTAHNYYREFHKFLTDPSKGYPYLVEKLKHKIATLDAQQQ